MGQQSVGKSFALNHLLDTSFAGSAMRTTGTVANSVIVCGCTKVNRGCMVVCNSHRRCVDRGARLRRSVQLTSALMRLIYHVNCIGVDSVERSLQEDTLLVLFNTAISNLV